jgi:hypothetical protein
VSGVTPDIKASFNRIQSTNDATAIRASDDALHEQIELQTQLQQIMTRGSAAMEDLTTRTTAYNSALSAGKDIDVATAISQNALLEVQAKRKTAGDQLIETLKRQNDLDSSANQDVQLAGSDPVARSRATLDSQLSRQAEDARRANPQLNGAAYLSELQRQQGNQASRSVNDAVAASEKQLKDAQALALVSSGRADVQARLTANMQIEAQYTKEIAQAQEAAQGGSMGRLDAVLQQIDKLKQLKAEIDLINATGLVIKGNVDIANQSSLNTYEAGRTPEQRRLDQEALPSLRSGGFVANSPVATSIQQDAIGQGVDPTLAGMVAQRESSMGQRPNTSGSYSGIYSMGAPAYQDVGAPAPGPNGYSQQDQIHYGVARVGQMQRAAQGVLGRPASYDDAYLLYQQGQTGGAALLRANQSNPGMNAVDALVAAGVPRDQAIAHITQNSGTVSDTAADLYLTLAGLNARALTQIGSATDTELLQLRDVYLQNPNDPRILALPPAQRERLANVSEQQRSALGLASAGTTQSADQQLAASRRSAVGAAAGPAGSLSASVTNTVTGELQSGQLAPSAVPQRSSQLIAADATDLLKTINEQNSAMQVNTNQTEMLAKAWGGGAAAAQQLQESLKTAPLQAHIEALKAQQNQTDATRSAITADQMALDKLTASTKEAATASADLKLAQATSGIRDQNTLTQASLTVPFYATDQQRSAAAAEAQKQLYLANNPNASDDAKAGYSKAIDDSVNLKQQVADASTLQNAYKSASSALTSGFENAIVSGANLHSVMATVLQDLEKIAINAAIQKPLENAFSSAFGGAGSWLSGLFSSGAGGTMGAAPADILGASGHLFMDGRPIRPFAAGGMLDRPTFFQMASGGTALGGENGLGEALMPVRRLPNGDLGIQSQGGGHTISVQAPVTINGGQSGQSGTLDKNTANAMQQQMEATVRAAVKNVMQDEMRPGGMLYQ